MFVMGIIIAALCCNVGISWNPVQTLDLCALFRRKAVHVDVVIVGMLPNGARRVLVCIDEELVVFFGVILSHPAWWEGPRFVLHTPARLRRDAIAGLVGNV